MTSRLRAAALALGLVLGAPPIVAAAPANLRETRASIALSRLVEGYWQEHLRLRPLHATLLGDHRYDGELPDNLTSAQLGREYALEKRSLVALLAIDAAALQARDRLTYDTFRWEREVEIEGYRYPAELMPVTPSGGLPSLMAQFGSGSGAQPFNSVRDYDNWLRRLDSYVSWLDRAVVNLRRGLSRGYVIPKVVVAHMLPQLQSIAEAPLDQSLYMRPVLAFPETVPAPEQARLRRAYREAVGDRLIPAYRRLYEFLQHDYLPRARVSVSWSDLPQGRAWYAYRVRRATTTSLTPDELHRAALDEVRRAGADADRVASEIGLHGDRRANLEALRADPHAYFERDEDVVAAIVALKVRIRQRLAEFVDPPPRAEIDVRAVDAARAAGAAALTFRPGSADGSRPGVLYVNAAELRLRPRFEMDAAYLREVEPGRALEVALMQDVRGLPNFRRHGGYLAFTEGWGLYVEGLGRDFGLYADGPSQYAVLQLQLLRAARVVVDTGMHALGWSRDRAVDYLVANTSLGPEDAAAEVDRAIANPAQALAFETGALRLRALRAHASQLLGARFDARAFHRQLLANGPLPLDVVARELDRWLASQGTAP